MDNNELLARLDERTINIYNLTAKIEKHLDTLNGTVATNCKDIAGCKTSDKWTWRFISAITLALIGFILYSFLG